MLLMLAACNAAETDVQTDWTARQMAAAIWDAGTQLDGTEILPGDELYETYITDNYCLDASEIEDGAIWTAGCIAGSASECRWGDRDSAVRGRAACCGKCRTGPRSAPCIRAACDYS